jgi:hypothetical protein
MSEKFCSALVAFSVGFSYPPATLPLRKIYFDKAVLNVNPITPFGGQAASNSLPQPCTGSFYGLIKPNICNWQSFTMKADRKANDC